MGFQFDIFEISSEAEFNSVAHEIFDFQFENNPVYRSFCDLINRHPSDISTLADIPFLPIQFFKTHKVLSTSNPSEIIFESSGTTGEMVSKHHVTNSSLYEKSFMKVFEYFYGQITDYTILALLPSYQERPNSSLIYMVNTLIDKSNNPKSGFLPYADLNKSASLIREADQGDKKVLCFAVPFALLDLLELHQFSLGNTILIETGGMKGRRKEMIRSELHKLIKKGLSLEDIHSEYGMTELLSQAYSKGNGVFETPPWMKILIRDPEDALSILNTGQSGGINIIDLGNYNSCSFIATQDLGRMVDSQFEVLGRFDNSDIRGCNLLVL